MHRRYWSVASTHWREESRAAHHIERLGCEYYLPLTYALDGERRVRLFPGFIFVKLCEGWQALCSGTVRGVRRLLMVPDATGAQQVPARVSGAELARLRGMEDECGVVRLRPRLRNGDRVVVDEMLGGAYCGVGGMVRGMPSRGRVRVLFQMLGRAVTREFSESVLRAA